MTLTIANPAVPDLPRGLHDRWRKIPVAVAVDLDPTCQLSPAIRPLRPAGHQPHLCARAVTAHCAPPDFGAVLAALDHVHPGQVLVIAANGHPDNAMIGDILGGHLHRRGAAGIICDGAIRDTATLASLPDFSVFTRHINPRGPSGASRGTVNHSVIIAGLTVAPGDLILGDDDGLAALSPERLTDLIDAAEAKLKLEDERTAQLTAGTPVRQIFGLD